MTAMIMHSPMLAVGPGEPSGFWRNSVAASLAVALHVGVVPIAGCPCLPERVEPNKRVCTCCFGIARACSVHKVCVQQSLRPAGA